MPIPSDQSYGDFVQLAFYYLINPGPVQPNAGVAVSVLYNLYCHYTPYLNIQAKVPLAGDELYWAMIEILDAAELNNRERIIRVQHKPLNQPVTLSVMDQPRAHQQYGTLALNNTITNTYPLAETALTSYLHVYPAGTQRQAPDSNALNYPQDRPVTSNWRIGINVLPGSIAAAVEALMPIMHTYKDIHHIKFSAPGRANKSDSAIIYLRKETATYNTIKGNVQQAMTNVEIQPKFSPMWNEFADGYGEAAEAPTNGFSFGVFRCILAYLAIPRRPSTAATLTLSGYLARVDETFETFGIPLFAPHEQGPLWAPPYNHPIRLRFMRALALYSNLPADTFQNLQLTAR